MYLRNASSWVRRKSKRVVLESGMVAGWLLSSVRDTRRGKIVDRRLVE